MVYEHYLFFLQYSAGYEPSKGRLNKPPSYIAKTNDIGQWIQVDLGDHQEMLSKNEAHFSSIHFFVIMTIYLFHCEELYDCLNFAGPFDARKMLLPFREGRYFFASPP